MITWAMTMIRSLRHDQKGATAIEYGLIAALVAVIIIVGLTALGGKLDTLFTTISNDL